ncbi:hypothetical protein SAY87_013164 [Trapa incisa]|uniref:Uncharacterized protein n=1 Tax=Trapa incisa TaxID=236973 RepID=A0AAN7QCI7_9MYRT|nr:hypothetical protein SAY87_013164 [Trapa incisa]
MLQSPNFSRMKLKVETMRQEAQKLEPYPVSKLIEEPGKEMQRRWNRDRTTNQAKGVSRPANSTSSSSCFVMRRSAKEIPIPGRLKKLPDLLTPCAGTVPIPCKPQFKVGGISYMHQDI